jgi:predicted Zn-ribbon and HTH transcriptional regulator
MARYIDAELIPFSRDYSRFVATEDDVDNVPTADVVEVRHGEWVEQIRDYGKYLVTEGYKCSNCGFELTDNDYKYCPECGAKMDRERRENGTTICEQKEI